MPTGNSDITPPHHPTYGVELADETISALIRHSLPNLTTFAISRFPHGMSFNNKIYKIEPTDDEAESNQPYILKVNGRFFGAAKVENEVSCLLLLDHFCPDVPAPRAVAWSADGKAITRYDRRDKVITTSSEVTLGKETVPGWILMTFIPGSRMYASNISLEARSDLALQVSAILSSWRKNIPKSSTCANFHFQSCSAETANRSLYRPGGVTGLQLYVYGFLEYGNDHYPPVNSLLDYWKTELEWHVDKLSSEPVYATNREPLLAHLQKFVDETLSRLPLFEHNQESEFIFTHGDLFPRNILVQGDPPKISGIVDFEFSGFFTAVNEFSQEWLPNSDGSDWPPDMYETILEELERLGEATPRTASSTEWKQVKNLNLLRNYIAPWWLADLGEVEEDTLKQLQEARQEVEKALTELSQIAAP